MSKTLSSLWKDTWSGATAYTVGDIVSNDGSSYVCIANNTNQEPPNATYWGLLAQAGVVTAPASSVDSEVALFDGATGTALKRASGSGIAKLTSGVLSTVTAPSGAIVGDTDTQTLTGKTISGASNTLTIREADLSLSDNTTADVSTAKHGFAPKAPNDTTKYLRGDGTWAVPASSSSSTARARAYRDTSTQSISHATFTKVQLNAESYDPGNNFDSSTNYRFVAPSTGYYAVTGVILYTTTTTDKRYISAVYVNGSEVFENEAHASHANGLSVTTTDYIYLTANDYVELYTYHESGVSSSISNGSQYTYLSVQPMGT